MKKMNKYRMKRCKSVIIPNSDMLGISNEVFGLLCHNAMKEVENADKVERGIYEVQILISQIIYPFFKNMGMDFFDETTIKEINETGIYGYLWGSPIKIIDKLEHVIFIGEEIEDFEFETDGK